MTDARLTPSRAAGKTTKAPLWDRRTRRKFLRDHAHATSLAQTHARLRAQRSARELHERIARGKRRWWRLK